MEIRLTITEEASEEDRNAILEPLVAFNRANAVDPEYRPLNVLLLDGKDVTIGGLWGQTAWGWLTIKLLHIPNEFRGQGIGGRMLRAAESEAKSRGCHDVWVDTHTWQAKGFYTKLGYELFGELPDYPTGSSRYFLRKRLLLG